MGHRRQASKGLGILTDPDSLNKRFTEGSKNNAFFHASDMPTPRPPPSLRQAAAQACQSESSEDSQTYASRLRNVMAANRHTTPTITTTTAPVPSPIPNYLHAKATSAAASSHQSLSSLLPQSPVRRSGSYSDDEIMPLPTPMPVSYSPTEHPHYTFLKDRVIPSHSPVTPEEGPSISIPVIAVSPSFPPLTEDKIPSLSEEPMLGDVEDSTYHQKRIWDIPMTREQKFGSSLPIQCAEEEDLVKKQLDKYRIKKLLGIGAFSKVYLAENVDNGEKYAIKVIQKERMVNDSRMRSSIEREVGILKYIHHPNVVQLEATMETERNLCIVLEYARGGELFDFVQQMHRNQQLDEQLVKKTFLNLVQVVQWMHQHNIVHRDLKLENILVRIDDDGMPVVKVTDFGLARVVDPEAPTLTTRCGSEEYTAPEIVQGSGYDGRKTDTWALGIILYALLVGYLPFRYNPTNGERVSKLFYRIVKAEVKWPSNHSISAEARQVVERILVRNPDKRISLQNIANLPWFADTT
ncbi:hypothetical protein DFQ28_004659 [Apophysomyces sp. BC1034]|nr:hypothetical protein DFQ30_005643 [Apophysomyces sp. BC1015]KAG0183076.1 hypothetical protein DFQ29_000079 [Apophysomyces sp. BC1021]KAG0193539.1 hypothetical protein DFQ28_004659 [Apophysomyces sp. BC1034]